MAPSWRGSRDSAAPGLGLTLVPEASFLSWLTREESLAFELRAIPLLFVRNLAWLSGVLVGLLELPTVLVSGEGAA